MLEAGPNISAAKTNAQKYSQMHPEMYVTVYACFGLFLNVTPRLGTFAPSEDVGIGGYWKAGKFRGFTNSQIIADQNNTPTMM